jgi:hypothetical protein
VDNRSQSSRVTGRGKTVKPCSASATTGITRLQLLSWPSTKRGPVLVEALLTYHNLSGTASGG